MVHIVTIDIFLMNFACNMMIVFENNWKELIIQESLLAPLGKQRITLQANLIQP